VLIINRPQTNPWFNIAAEEYLLKNMQDDCFMLWQNKPSVIVGKHQNTMAEINHRYVKENSVPVIRRISGGGTVFHDLGNLNFSFIQSGERDRLVDFRRFVQPIINVLQNMGIPAKFEGKNDIRVNGLKISGNAEHVYKNKVLHHGTLLFSSELGNLNKSIKARFEDYEDKAVKSVRSTVANITDFIDRELSIGEFKNNIIEYILAHFADVHFYELSASEIQNIESLSKEKYETWEWNYGYSPKFLIQKKITFGGESFEIKMTIKNGLIEEVGTDIINAQVKSIVHSLCGEKLEIESLKRNVNNNIDIKNITENDVHYILESLVY
jgi:lipoate-protein ligase A